jgi:transposase-like protein
MIAQTLSGVTHIKVYTKKELAELYEIDRRTFNKWIKKHEEKIGEKTGRFYTTQQIKVIFEVLGLPSKIIEE